MVIETMIYLLLYRPGSGGPHPPPRLPFPLPLTGGLFPRFDYHHHYYYNGNDDNDNDSLHNSFAHIPNHMSNTFTGIICPFPLLYYRVIKRDCEL